MGYLMNLLSQCLDMIYLNQKRAEMGNKVVKYACTLRKSANIEWNVAVFLKHATCWSALGEKSSKKEVIRTAEIENTI